MGAGSTVVDCISTCLSVNASQGKLPRMRSIEDELVERQIPQPGPQQPVLRIHDILVWIRIRMGGSMPLTNGSGSIFSAYYFLKLLLHHFLKVKSQKEVTKE